MDPVSLTTAALTFIAASATTVKLVKSVIDAPSELRYLAEELANLSVLVSEVAAVEEEAKDGSSPSGSLKALRRLLEQAQIQLKKLEQFVLQLPTWSGTGSGSNSPVTGNQSPVSPQQQVGNNAPSSGIMIGKKWRVRWAFHHKRRAEKLLEEFKSTRQNLTLALAVHATHTSKENHEEQTKQITDTTDAQQNLSNRILDSTEEILAELHDGKVDSQKTQTQVMQQYATLYGGMDEQKDRMESMQVELKALHDLLLKQGPSATSLWDVSMMEKSPLSNDVEVIKEVTSDESNVYVRTTQRQIASYQATCKCSCHSEPMSPLDATSNSLIGRLFVSFAKTSSSRGCQKRCCKDNTAVDWKAVYVMPRWAASWVVSLAVAKVQAKDLSVRMAVRTYSADEEVFRLVELGDLEGVRRMISGKKVSPDEIERNYGQTALVWSINRGWPDIFDYLLNEGADPDIEDFSGRSVRTVAMIHFFQSMHNPREQHLLGRMKRIFWVDGGWEEVGVSRVQQVVLGLREGNLEDEIRNATTDIDYRDRSGRTALYWAASMNNVSALRTLLKFGANPDIRDDHGSTPINTASCSPVSPAAMSLLLAYRADISPPKKNGFSPLLHAAYHKNDLAFIEPLVRAGCDVNAVEVRGMNSLARAALTDRDVTARFLIKKGAHVNNVDYQGYSIVATAVQSGANKVLRLLIEQGADYDSVTQKGRTVLHVAAAARAANVETLELLKGIGLKNMDVFAKDYDGYTATDLMAMRADITDSFRKAFSELLESVRPPEPVGYGPSVDFYSLM